MSLAAFCLLAVVFLCGNAAAEKKLAFVTVVSNMYLSDKLGRFAFSLYHSLWLLLDGKDAATKLAC